jgi:drug/metabolite transporter superfamily protein YnfA
MMIISSFYTILKLVYQLRTKIGLIATTCIVFALAAASENTGILLYWKVLREKESSLPIWYIFPAMVAFAFYGVMFALQPEENASFGRNGYLYAAFFVGFNLLWAMIFDHYVPNLRDKVVVGMIAVTLLVGIFWP